MLFSQVYNSVIWVNYELNVEEITELFCENTDKPELNCHGSCHLKKQLIQTEDPNSENPVHLNYINELELFNPNDIIQNDLMLNFTPELNSHYSESFSETVSGEIFHPPIS